MVGAAITVVAGIRYQRILKKAETDGTELPPPVIGQPIGDSDSVGTTPSDEPPGAAPGR